MILPPNRVCGNLAISFERKERHANGDVRPGISKEDGVALYFVSIDANLPIPIQIIHSRAPGHPSASQSLTSPTSSLHLEESMEPAMHKPSRHPLLHEMWAPKPV